MLVFIVKQHSEGIEEITVQILNFYADENKYFDQISISKMASHNFYDLQRN